MRVLIVDDNVELAENVAELLADEGHQVFVASSGPSAIALMMNDPVCMDAALLDVRMDGMDGVELLAELKTRCPKMLFVMMTAFSRDDRLAQARELGAVDILAKPFAPNVLFEALQAA
ncbi:MAG: response regulator [Myxococcales bacterium]|nr:response regulator [Myxococcales bacterium]